MPACWVFSLLLLSISAVFHGFFALLLALDITAYALMAGVITVITFRETKKPTDLLLFLVIPIMHLSYGLAEWFEFFCPDRDFGVR